MPANEVYLRSLLWKTMSWYEFFLVDDDGGGWGGGAMAVAVAAAAASAAVVILMLKGTKGMYKKLYVLTIIS